MTRSIASTNIKAALLSAGLVFDPVGGHGTAGDAC